MSEDGSQLARQYELLHRLGGSESSPVWAARSRADDSRVALKLLAAGDSATARGLELQSRLSHPHIAAAPHLRTLADGQRITVAPLAARGDLGSLRGRPMAEFLPRLREVAEAMAYLHAQGLVHGDLKSQNVLLTETGAELGDFATALPAGVARDAMAPYSPRSASPGQRAGAAAVAGDDIHSFGAMLFELLTGQPPGHDGRALPASAADLRPVHPAPEALRQLALDCLATSAAVRPADFNVIAATLDAVAALPLAETRVVPLLTPPPNAADVLRPTWKRGDAASLAVPDAAALRRAGFRRGLLAAGALVLVLAAAAAFILPALQKPAARASAPAAVERKATAPATPAEEDLKSLAAIKSTVETRLEGLQERWQALQQASARQWDPVLSGSLGNAFAALDQKLKDFDYRGAQHALPEIDRQLKALETERGSAFAAAMKRGQEALVAGRSADAAAAFAQALTLDPGSAPAKAGAARAASLDRVYALLAEAQAAEQSGNASGALALYRKALGLDAQAPGAAGGIARLSARFANDQFGALVARGYEQLGDRKFDAARKSFEAARAIRPAAAEVGTALAQVAAAEQGATLQQTLVAAQSAVAAERWDDAVRSYQQALALDNTLSAARQGLDLATQRAELDHSLRRFNEQPERLYTADVRRGAVNLLANARALENPGPLLLQQLGALEQHLQAADTPVQVALRSDGLTSITIYKVGEQGAFAERVVSLRPGHYIAVGTRPGFRDVRQEFNVLPGQSAAQPIQIACVDPI